MASATCRDAEGGEVSRSNWRSHAEHVIERVLRECSADVPPDEVERRVDAAYPFGMRDNHPYKIWLDVRRKALAARFPNGKQARAIRDAAMARANEGVDPAQRQLF